ncbi:hypothetical protein ACROYT_G029442 [Oculina patagonica]
MNRFHLHKSTLTRSQMFLSCSFWTTFVRCQWLQIDCKHQRECSKGLQSETFTFKVFLHYSYCGRSASGD